MSEDGAPGALTRAKTSATARWSNARARHASLRHVVEAWGLLQRNNGNQYAAAITYFSFLALFPLLLLAVAVTGFVLSSHPAAQQSLFAHVTQQVPGQFGTTLKSSIQSAIDARTGVGIVGLVGVLLTGLGWIGNLRAAIDAVWGRPQARQSFLGGRVANLLVLAGLGLGILVSLGLTVVGTALTDEILRLLSLDHVPGVFFVVKILGIALAVAGDMIIFWWLLIKLPDADVPKRIAWRGALLASVGFEALKIVGTYTIAATTHSKTAGPFAGVLAVLIWIQLVARFMLFSCAWTATLAAEHRTVLAPGTTTPAPDPSTYAGPGGLAADTPAPQPAEPHVRPATVGATLVGAGALAGVVATWAYANRRRAR